VAATPVYGCFVTPLFPSYKSLLEHEDNDMMRPYDVLG